MKNAANVGDTSLADVDSIDTPPRVSPSSSPLLTTTTTTAATAGERRSVATRQRDRNMEDIFKSQTSWERGEEEEQERCTTATSAVAGAAREGSGGSTTTAATTTTRSSIGNAVRTRVPSKEMLYRRHRSSSSISDNRGHTKAPMQVSEPRQSSPPRMAGQTSAATSTPPPTGSALPTAAPTTALSGIYSSHGPAPAAATTKASSTTFQRTASVGSDALLQRMKQKEREFDAKIHVIHDTFQNAGEQLVMRDSIIAQLQDELAALRRESHRIPVEYQARERTLLQRVEEVMNDLREEQARTQQQRRSADDAEKRLRAALTSAEAQLAQQQRVSDDLLRQLRASDKALHEAKLRHAAALQDNRHAYEQKLADVERAYHQAEKDLAKARVRGEEAERDRAESQARLLEQELDSRRRHTSDAHRAKEFAAERAALTEEVEAVRLSMARLLHLLSAVPTLANYLQWNELGSEFVFLGYPTRYFAAEGNPQRSRHTSPVRRRPTGPAPSFNAVEERDGEGRGERSSSSSVGYGISGVHRRSPGTARRPASPVAASYYHDANVSGGSLGETGVDEGVYAGVASSLSKNVWLNGRWAQQMMDIIAAENNFTRLKRIRLLELEEAAQLSEQLPSARDVLECRRPEQDYWIPYAVFTEAQRFKNKYYPKLPALSHFYPFLIQLNKIWRARLHDRLRVRQGERQKSPQAQQQQNSSFSDASLAARRGGVRTAAASAALPVEGDVNSRIVSRSGTASYVADRHSGKVLQHLLLQCENRSRDLHAEHHRLRREVRLHISSQRSLQLFRVYDELVRSAHRSLAEMAHLASELQDSISAGAAAAVGGGEAVRSREADMRRTAAADALRAEQIMAEMEAEASAAADARDRLSCVVERTCERVCDVGDTLSTRMASYYSDLHQLIQMLHSHLRDLRAHGDGDGESDSSSSSDSGEGTRRRVRSSGKGSSSLRGALEAQYGAARTSAKPDVAGPAPQPTSPGPISGDSLLKLAASFLDFGEEMRKEVANASGALHAIVQQAMAAAEQRPQEEDEGVDERDR